MSKSMNSDLRCSTPLTRGRRARTRTASLGAVVILAACYNFNLTDPNGPTLAGLENSPNLASVDAAVTGAFARSRTGMTSMVWFVGSMGREGINLSGNNQPDYAEPYYGPLSGGGDAAAGWGNQFEDIRDANLVIDAAPKAPDMSAAQQQLAIGVAQALKALMFMQVIQTRADLGAPVDVDRAATGTPAPFVSEDSVYATILITLDSSLANLASGSAADFTFPLPPGYSLVNTPATFRQLVWGLKARAFCYRATAAVHDVRGGGAPGNAPTYYDSALVAVDSSFYGSTGVASGDLTASVNFDYSSNPGDLANTLSDPLGGVTFFADTFNITDAQKQSGGALDQRVLNKITTIPGDTAPQILGGIPQIQGWLKFTNYLSGGAVNTGAAIPLLKGEELALLRAEAEIGTGALAAALGDINLVRTGSGHLPAYGVVNADSLTKELLYNRRYSMLWEGGYRWIDARRFGVLSSIEPGWNPANFSSSFPAPTVPTRMPIPSTECEQRNLGTNCSPLGT